MKLGSCCCWLRDCAQLDLHPVVVAFPIDRSPISVNGVRKVLHLPFVTMRLYLFVRFDEKRIILWRIIIIGAAHHCTERIGTLELFNFTATLRFPSTSLSFVGSEVIFEHQMLAAIKLFLRVMLLR
jgi:hypothetical protein